MTDTKKLATISVKSIGFSAKEIRKLVEGANGETVFLARIGGVAQEHFTGESKHGDYIGFKGQFFVITKDGDRYESKTAFFPSSVGNKLREQFEQGVVDIEVKADVYAVESEKNASGYAYLCEPIMTSETQEKLNRLQKSILDAPMPTATLAIADKSQAKKKTA